MANSGSIIGGGGIARGVGGEAVVRTGGSGPNGSMVRSRGVGGTGREDYG